MKKWLLMSAATVFIAIAVLAFLLFPGNSEQTVTLAEAEETVIGLYGGAVENTAESGNHFVVDFNRDDGRYQASVNKNTGQVESMELVEKAEQGKKLTEEEAAEIASAEVEGTVENNTFIEERNEYEVQIAGQEENATVFVSVQTGEIRKISTEAAEPDPKPEPEPERIITRDEAAAIARKTLEGEVQEVEFTQTEDGGYYLVEIENEETEQEVTVQVHAIRGETMTVEWDD